MIISASRRTDIPAFYSRWFLNRLREGYCTVPNPFNQKQVARVSLAPTDVDVLVFWTRNPAPLLQHLPELDRLGYSYYFQFTILGYPREFDRKVPSLQSSIDSLARLVDHVGPDRVIWRYDPIVLTNSMGNLYHLEKFDQIARSLDGMVHRCTISLMDFYKKIQIRMSNLRSIGISILEPDSEKQIEDLLKGIVEKAGRRGIVVYDCAEVQDWGCYGIQSGKCIDDRYIKNVFGIETSSRKDPGQRKACGCVVSRDIGMYDSCIYGCQYCYATSSFERAKQNHQEHDPTSPSLLGWYEACDA